MQPHPSSKVYFNRLDTLRFFAFLLVFLNHTTDFLRFPSSVTKSGTAAFTYFQVGDLGVGFFFVLSGFLITYLLEKERGRTKTISIKDFYIRRVLRIWPLYFLVFTIIVLVSIIFHGFDLYKIGLDKKEILTSLFFVGNIFKAFHYTANEMIAVLWSIAVEEQFYLVWPVIFLIFRRYITYVLFLGIFISMYVRYKYANNFPVREFYTLTVMVYLLVGALIGIHGVKIKEWVKCNSFTIKISAIISILILLSIRGFAFINSYPKWFISLDGLLFAVFFALIILASAFGEQNSKQNLFNRTTEYLGTVSYGLYVYHLVALTVVLNILGKMGFDYKDLGLERFLTIATLSFALVVLVSFLSYKYFERPFLLLKKKFISRA